MTASKHRNSHAFRMDKIDLGMLILQVRTVNRLTLRELSEMSGVAFYMISNIESGKSSPSLFTISRIFNSMGLSVSDAYSMIESPNTIS